MTDVRGRYFAWVRAHPEWAEVPIDAFTDVWRYSATSALRASAEFAGVVSNMRELIWWFEAGPVDDAAEAWAQSNANTEERAIRAEDLELEELPF